MNILWIWCILFFSAAGTTCIPRLIPLVYITISGMLLAWGDPFYITLFVWSWAVFWTSSLWFLNAKIDTIFKHWYPKFSPNESHRLGRKIVRIHNKLHIVNKKRILMFLVACTTRSAIPDILIIRTVRHKLPFSYFFLAVLIGKFFVYTPFIYGLEVVEMLRQYFK